MYRSQFQYDDPYNYKPLQRNDLMNLQTITQKDVGFPKYRSEQPRDFTLRTDDIKGSQPKGEYPFTNKQNYQNKCDDIQGTQPKKVILDARPIQYRDNTLNITDIKGAQPRINKFETNRKQYNPLEPQYQLPQVTITNPDPPKFLRNTLDISDIDGTRPKKDKQMIPIKNPYIKEEIPGSKPKKQFIPNNKQSSLDIKDINGGAQWKTNRHTDHFNPVYVSRDEDNKVYQYGEIQKSKPQFRHSQKQISPQFSLSTNDIPGAQADTHSNIIKKRQRDQFGVTNNTSDIFGAQKNTLQKGLNSKRNLNPLRPEYNYPGNTEDIQGFHHENNRYKNTNFKDQSPQSNQGFNFSSQQGGKTNGIPPLNHSMQSNVLQNTASQNLLGGNSNNNIMNQNQY